MCMHGSQVCNNQLSLASFNVFIWSFPSICTMLITNIFFVILFNRNIILADCYFYKRPYISATALKTIHMLIIVLLDYLTHIWCTFTVRPSHTRIHDKILDETVSFVRRVLLDRPNFLPISKFKWSVLRFKRPISWFKRPILRLKRLILKLKILILTLK